MIFYKRTKKSGHFQLPDKARGINREGNIVALIWWTKDQLAYPHADKYVCLSFLTFKYSSICFKVADKDKRCIDRSPSHMGGDHQQLRAVF